MTYYNIWQGINETCTILPYITWELIQDPQNSRGIPDKVYTVFKIKETFQRGKIINIDHNGRKRRKILY